MINAGNIDKIQARSIVPAANIPFEPGIVPHLQERGISILPDFIANGGEILASVARYRTSDPVKIYANIKQEIQTRVFKLLGRSAKEKKSTYEIAVAQCQKVFFRHLRRRERKRGKGVEAEN
jgi:glutamate dehydrogenase (NAD(P)+)